MSKRNQLRATKKLLAELTTAIVVDGVRGIINDMDTPSWQQATLFIGSTGEPKTCAEVKAQFPDYKSNKFVITELVAAYLGRFTRHALAINGIAVEELSMEEVQDLMAVTNAVEQKAIVRMTAN